MPDFRLHTQDDLIHLLETLVNSPSHSLNIDGTTACLEIIRPIIDSLSPDECAIKTIQNSPYLLAKKQIPNTPHLLFNIHLDTVFENTHDFNTFTRVNPDTATGPGVIDAKGGLVILLKTLSLIHTKNIPVSWTVFLNTDEEIGTPYSYTLLQELGKQATHAFVFEPCLENGHFIDARPASSNITITSKGTQAHAGRHYKKGNNAITHLINFLHTLPSLYPEKMIVNIGKINGGIKESIIPDHAEAQLNCRCFSEHDYKHFLNQCYELATENIDITEHMFRPANPLTEQKKILLSQLEHSYIQNKKPFQTEHSYGVCDGNFIASTGTPTIDTCGPLGSGMHTHNEQIHLPSLEEKALLLGECIEQLSQKSHS